MAVNTNMNKSLGEMWETLVTDQQKDERDRTVNPFIRIMRGRLLGALSTYGADGQANNIYYQKGHELIRDVNTLYHEMVQYAMKKSRMPIPSRFCTVADEIDFPRIDRDNEISSLFVAVQMYRSNLTPVKDIEAFLNAQFIIAMYGTEGMTKATIDYFDKMTDLWKDILTGRNIIIPDEAVRVLTDIANRMRNGE